MVREFLLMEATENKKNSGYLLLEFRLKSFRVKSTLAEFVASSSLRSEPAYVMLLIE